MLEIVLASELPMNLIWGPERVMLFNDAYVPFTESDYADNIDYAPPDGWPTLGTRGAAVWSGVTERGESISYEDRHRVTGPDGRQREVCVDFHMSPVRVEDGSVGGVLVVAMDSTVTTEARRRLRESADRLTAVTEKVPFGILLTELPEFTVVSVNDTALRSLELTREEVVGKTSLELGISDLDEMARIVEALRRQGTAHPLELVRSSRSGETRVFSLGAATLLLDGHEHCLLLLSDITDRRRALEELRRSEAEVRATVESLTEGVVVVAPDGTIVMANHAIERIFGYPIPVLLAARIDFQRALRSGGAIPIPADAELMATAMSTGQPYRDVEVRVPHADGSIHWISVSEQPFAGPRGEPGGFVASVLDITARKKAEAERDRLQREKEEQRGRLQAILDSLPVGILIVDAAGKLEQVNDRAMKTVGGPRPEPIRSVEDVVRLVARSGERVKALTIDDLPLTRALRDEVCCEEFIEFERPDGTRSMSLVSAAPIRGSNGTLLGAVVLLRDITEVKQLERLGEEILAANARLREAEERKDSFLAMLSHELRNPLAPIRNSLYILDRAVPGSERAHTATTVIQRQVEHMTRLIDDLLDVTRIARGQVELHRERLDLNDLVRRAGADHRSSFVEAGIELRVEPASTAFWVSGDRTRLSQVIRNLLHNAAKFTPRGGTTTLSVRGDPALAQASISIQDSGRGMTPAVLSNLFEPGFQANDRIDRQKGGLGIGLALARGLIDMHGGTIGATSDGLGRGSTFTFTLPVEPTVAIEPSSEVGQAAKSGKSVLIIEDNVDVAESLRAVLELCGHRVEVAHDGMRGLEKVRAMLPDVVLCDIGLPEMDGYEVARAIRADPKLDEVSLIAVSGYAQPEDVARAKAAGIDVHIPKPPSIEVLQRVLSEVPRHDHPMPG